MKIRPGVRRIAKAPGKQADGAGKRRKQTGGSKFKSTTESQRLISRYHTLLKLEAAAQKENRPEDAEKYALEREALGGIDSYQKASIFGESTQQNGEFSSSAWVLKDIESRTEQRTDTPLRLLDVGCVVDHYATTPVSADCIDLNPQADGIIKADLIEYLPGARAVYDAVVLSLCVNFEGDAQKRGRMLAKAATLTRPGGRIYLVLPLACVSNSRYMKHGRIVAMMKALGCGDHSVTKTSKLAMYIFTMGEEGCSGDPTRVFPRKLCRGGAQRNNFCIILDGGEGDDNG